MQWAKIFPFFQLALPLVVATFLVYLQISAWRSSESVARKVAENRATVAVFVQVTAYLLGMLQVQALCTSITANPIAPLADGTQHVEFIHAASIPKLSLNAGKLRFMVLLMIVVLSLAPGAIFSASLTPVQSQRNFTRSIQIPTFDTSNPNDVIPTPYWNWMIYNPVYFQGNSTADNLIHAEYATNVETLDYTQWMSKQGVYTYDPTAKRSALLNSASFASLNFALDKLHAKLDNAGYFYVNRSYGAGTAAGFMDLAGLHEPKWYTYRESGFRSHVSCHYNQDVTFELAPVANNLSIAVYIAEGNQSDPANTPVFPARYLSLASYDVLALTAVYSNETTGPNHKGIYVSVRALADDTDDCWDIRYFDKFQCRIHLEAQDFHVHVNETSKVITVSPDDNKSKSWPFYGDAVATEIALWLWTISALEGSFAGSVLGRAMGLNREQLRSLKLYDSPDELTSKALEDFLADMVDNILNLLATTRFVTAGHSTSVKSQVTVDAVVLGSKMYAIAVLVISTLALSIYLGMAVSTLLWRDMIDLDLTDMAQVISSTLIGGSISTPAALSTLITGGSQSRLILSMHGNKVDQMPILEAFAVDSKDEKMDDDSSPDVTTQQSLPLAPHSYGYNDNEPSDG